MDRGDPAGQSEHPPGEHPPGATAEEEVECFRPDRIAARGPAEQRQPTAAAATVGVAATTKRGVPPAERPDSFFTMHVSEWRPEELKQQHLALAEALADTTSSRASDEEAKTVLRWRCDAIQRQLVAVTRAAEQQQPHDRQQQHDGQQQQHDSKQSPHWERRQEQTEVELCKMRGEILEYKQSLGQLQIERDALQSENVRLEVEVLRLSRAREATAGELVADASADEQDATLVGPVVGREGSTRRVYFGSGDGRMRGYTATRR
jgi:hypothetical protein